eukprot:1154324-Pelagomonas_calceolata.AAC.2
MKHERTCFTFCPSWCGILLSSLALLKLCSIRPEKVVENGAVAETTFIYTQMLTVWPDQESMTQSD